MTPLQRIALKYPEANHAAIQASATRITTIYNGDLPAAAKAASEMAYGNVSLRARATMAPVADFLDYMLEG